MTTSDRGALGEFVRKHHLHYEVDPEEVVEGGRRETVGARLRLFATHEREKLAVPGCRECVDLLAELRSFADRVVRTGDAADRTDVVPAPPALYASTEVPDADEVALTLRVRCASPEHRRSAGEDPCLGGIRERLADAGVPRR